MAAWPSRSDVHRDTVAVAFHVDIGAGRIVNYLLSAWRMLFPILVSPGPDARVP